MPKSARPRRHRQSQAPSLQAQLELQLDYSQSEPGDLSQSRGLSKGRHSRRRRGRIVTSLASHEQHGIVQASYAKSNNDAHIRQRQRFLLTSLNSTHIVDVNENRWHGHGATLPSLETCKEPEPRSGCSHVRGGSRPNLRQGALARDGRRPGLPALRLLGCLYLHNPQAVQMQSLQPSVLGHFRHDLRQPQASGLAQFNLSVDFNHTP